VEIGDRVLVRNVGLQGRHKIANRWSEEIYVVVEQPNTDIPVFVVKREGKSQATRTLHRNLLLPVNFLPLPHDLKQEREVHVKKPAEEQEAVVREVEVGVPEEEEEGNSDEGSNFNKEDLAVAWVANPLFVLDPGAESFVPRRDVRETEETGIPATTEPEGEQVEVLAAVLRRSTRERRQPEWQTSGIYDMA